jgi:hypothetical protein
MSEPVLCFIKDNTAYFTTQELSKQTGDDWNDAPYEHNAGRPYKPFRSIPEDWNEDGTPKWEISEVIFKTDLVTPEEYHYGNSSYCVEDINAKYVPWLATAKYSSDPKVTIHAGVTITEFKRLIRSAGGKIYVEEKE